MADENRGRVLVVDDEPDAALSLTTLLSLRGYSARACHDGPTALALAEKFRPTACVLDIMMPGMDGYELARRLRDLLGRDLVLVAVTGRSGDEFDREAVRAGFDWTFRKPAEPDMLLAALAASAAGDDAAPAERGGDVRPGAGGDRITRPGAAPAAAGRGVRPGGAAGPRVRAAALLFAAVALGTIAALAGIILAAEGVEATGWVSVAVLALLLAVTGATANVVASYARQRRPYRCPRCRAHVPRVTESEDGLEYHCLCTACGEAWSKAWYEVPQD